MKKLIIVGVDERIKSIIHKYREKPKTMSDKKIQTAEEYFKNGNFISPIHTNALDFAEDFANYKVKLHLEALTEDIKEKAETTIESDYRGKEYISIDKQSIDKALSDYISNNLK